MCNLYAELWCSITIYGGCSLLIARAGRFGIRKLVRRGIEVFVDERVIYEFFVCRGTMHYGGEGKTRRAGDHNLFLNR